MPTTHEATATWRGDLAGGKGNVSTKSGALKQAATSWKERTEGTGSEGATSPEELLAAAHASCFAMAFSARLAKAGVADPNITVTARPGSKAMAWPLRARGQMPGSGYVWLVHRSATGSYCQVSSSSPSPRTGSRCEPPNMTTCPIDSSKAIAWPQREGTGPGAFFVQTSVSPSHSQVSPFEAPVTSMPP